MLLYWFILLLAWVLVHLLFRFEIVGREHLEAAKAGGPLVIAPNHISMLDPVFVAVAVMDWGRMNILAKQELFKNPLLGWFFRTLGAVAIDRGKGDTATLDRVTEACKNGTRLLIFPEGTRTKTGSLGPLKGGAFLIAGQSGAAMLPCRILYGTKDGRMHLFCRVRLCFGPALPPETFAIADPDRKVAALRGMKNALKAELEALLEANRFEPAAP